MMTSCQWEQKEWCFTWLKHHPVRVDLSVTLRVQNDCLIGSEICKCDFSTFWTHVNHIHHRIIVKVILTYVTDSVP